MIDLDQFIEEREGRTIQKIIDEESETRFREIETRALRDVLESSPARVIALGGGAWTIDRNRALIVEHRCFTVWLDAPFDVCWQRILRGGDMRPLARHKDRALQLYNERRSLYQLAALRVHVKKGRTVRDLAAEIANAM